MIMILSGWHYVGLAAYCCLVYCQDITSSGVCVVGVVVVVASNWVSGVA